MIIREAVPEDGASLQALQAEAPQGKSLVVSTVNVPDFFSRAKAYEMHKVFVAEENDEIIGSAACAVRDAIIGDSLLRAGYEFQYFTSPAHRRSGVARRLRQRIARYLVERGASLSYALIMEGNVPSMRLFETEGFTLHRELVMPGIIPTKKSHLSRSDSIRPMSEADLQSVVKLVTETWEGHELFEPLSATSLVSQFERIPTFNYDDVLVLEDQEQLLACVGLWDWSQIMRITVVRLSLKMRILGKVLVWGRVLPQFLSPGDTLRQMMLTMIGFKSADNLRPLVKHVNNLALRKGFEQIFCICEKNDRTLEALKGFARVDTGLTLYTKKLDPDVSLAGGPVAMTGFDM